MKLIQKKSVASDKKSVTSRHIFADINKIQGKFNHLLNMIDDIFVCEKEDVTLKDEDVGDWTQSKIVDTEPRLDN